MPLGEGGKAKRKDELHHHWSIKQVPLGGVGDSYRLAAEYCSFAALPDDFHVYRAGYRASKFGYDEPVSSCTLVH